MHMLVETLAVTGSVVLDRGYLYVERCRLVVLYTVVAGDQRPAGRTEFNYAQSSECRK
jgi:hypothetical protein